MTSFRGPVAQAKVRTLIAHHHLALSEMLGGYDVFSRAGATGALTVVLTR